MEVIIFLNIHPPGNDLIFGPTCPQPRALLKKNSNVPTKFEKWPCSRKIWEATMLQKIWEATMLHQKINMIVFLQTDFSNYGGTLF